MVGPAQLKIRDSKPHRTGTDVFSRRYDAGNLTTVSSAVELGTSRHFPDTRASTDKHRLRKTNLKKLIQASIAEPGC